MSGKTTGSPTKRKGGGGAGLGLGLALCTAAPTLKTSAQVPRVGRKR